MIYAEKLLEGISPEERVGNDYPKGSKNKIFLKELKESITKKYSGNIGLEFSHISDDSERNWIIDRFENNNYKKINLNEKIFIL